MPRTAARFTQEIKVEPRGLRRPEAAAYVGVGPTLFDEMVADGRMPGPKSVNSCRIWDRRELDLYFDNLDDLNKDAAETDPYEGVHL